MIFFLALISSCGRPSKVYNQLHTDLNDSASILIEYNNVVFCLPSPHRVTKYFLENNLEFEEELIIKPTATLSYQTNFQKALHIGIFGTNQGYQILFLQDKDSMTLFKKVKDLTNSLGLLDAIDPESLMKIENQKFDSDTILYYLANSYREVNTYAQNQNKHDLSALIIAGGWIESFYLLTEMQIQNENKNLSQQIAEHKFALDNLIKVLSPFYDTNRQFKELIDKLVDIAYDLDAVEFEYKFLPPETHEEKMYTIVKSTSKVQIGKDQLNHLSTKIKSLRNAVLNQI